MLNFFQTIDIEIFYFINNILSNSVLDKIMPFITNSSNWILLYILLFTWLLWKGGRSGRFAVLFIIITIVITDQVSSNLIKNLVGRLRPCHTLDDVILLVSCSSGKSMPSSHAANNFAFAVILSYFFSKYKYIYYSLAALIAFSRVYVGVHYPTDILAGTLLGIFIANIILFLNQRTLKIPRIS